MHGGFAADEVVVKHEVSCDACIDSLQCVSPHLRLLPFSGAARARAEGAHGVLAIVDLDANHPLLGFRRESAHAVAIAASGTMQPVFHGRASILQRLTVVLETGVDHAAHFAALRANAVHAAELGVHDGIDAVFEKCPGWAAGTRRPAGLATSAEPR